MAGRWRNINVEIAHFSCILQAKNNTFLIRRVRKTKTRRSGEEVKLREARHRALIYRTTHIGGREHSSQLRVLINPV